MKFLTIFLISIPLSMWAQKDVQFTVSVSSDTIGLNGSLEVVFTLENAQGKRFAAPKFDGFSVQGPSTSMMTRIVNGEMTQSSSYTYHLTPNEIGNFTIGAATIDVNGETLKTTEKNSVVLEKYDAEIKPNRRQQPDFWGNDDFFFRQPTPPQPTPQPKKKYQTEKL